MAREAHHHAVSSGRLPDSFWLLNAAIWVHNYGLKTDFGVTLSALLLLATWLTIWRFSHERPDLVVAASASAVTLCAPTDWLLVNGSTGLMALAGSALLFVIGFALAWDTAPVGTCAAVRQRKMGLQNPS
jgi:hypothetical protein